MFDLNSILNYRSYIDIIFIVIGAVAILFLIRPILAWYFKQDAINLQLKQVNLALKNQANDIKHLQTMIEELQLVSGSSRHSNTLSSGPNNQLTADHSLLTPKSDSTPKATAATPSATHKPTDNIRKEPTINFGDLT
jgi:hypothetical protein